MQIHVYPEEILYNVLAEKITGLIEQTLLVKEIFTWALSGGETPKKLYNTLAGEPYREKINWSRVHIFWGDERFVPFTNNDNNAKMAYDSLLSKIPIPPEQVHRIWTDVEAEQSVKQYEQVLRDFFDTRETTFDLVLLGLGEDGHTLSLFPGDPIPNEQHWVSPVSSDKKGIRITLLPGIVNKASSVFFVVTGEKKAGIIKEILSTETPPLSYPAMLIQPYNGELHWFLDTSAAEFIT
ncbi:MAG: 6-phosphogluconolactonase [Chitinophagaceae bacterium]|nr:6-phosphogluconolactonase [Chitinophagaceae bacterium]